MATGTASEREVLESWLDFHRGVAVRKVADLTMSSAQTRLVRSQTTLAGLLHHLAVTEREWFQQILSGQPARPDEAPEDPDTSWVVGEDDTPQSPTLSQPYGHTRQGGLKVGQQPPACDHSWWVGTNWSRGTS